MTAAVSPASPAEWAKEYLGRPWRPDYTCWDFAAQAQKELYGRHLPRVLIPGQTPDMAAVRKERLAWTRSDQPVDGALVEMARGRMRHVGVYLDPDGGRVLHNVRGIGVVADRAALLGLSGWNVRGFWVPGQQERPAATAQVVRVSSIGAAIDLVDVLQGGHYAMPVAVGGCSSVEELARKEGFTRSPVLVFQPPGVIPDFDPEDETAAAEAYGLLSRAQWAAAALDRPTIIVDLPAGGGGGSNPLKTILMVAVIVAASILTGGVAAGLVGFTATTLTAVAGYALLAVGPLLINHAFPPSAPGLGSVGGGAQASPTYSLSPQNNLARLTEMVPVQFGRHKHFVDYASQPFAMYEGVEGHQVLRQLFCLGTGEYTTEAIYAGDTLIWENGAPVADIEGVAASLYGPAQPVTDFTVDVRTSPDVRAIELEQDEPTPWFSAADTEVQTVQVDVHFPRGLFAGDKFRPTFVAYSIEMRRAGQAAAEHSYFCAFSSGSAISGYDVVAGLDRAWDADRRVSPINGTHSFDMPEAARWEVRFIRQTYMAKPDQGADLMCWSGLRGVVPEENTFDDVSILALKLVANEGLSAGSSQRISVIKTRLLPPIGGGELRPSRSIGEAAAWLLREHNIPFNGPELERLNTIWAARGWTFDMIMDQRMSLWTALQTILRAGAAKPVKIGDQVHFRMDEAQSIPSQVFGTRNILKGSLTETPRMRTPDQNGQIVAEYWSGDTWSSDEVTVGDALDYGLPTRVRYEGVTDAAQTQALAELDLRAAKLRHTQISFDVEMEGRLVLPHDLITVVHPDLGSGEQVDVLSGDKTAFALAHAPGAQGHIEFTLRRPDGTEWGPCQGWCAGRQLEPDDAGWMLLAAGDNPADWLDFQSATPPIASIASRGSWSGAYVVRGVSAAADGRRMTITAENYNPLVYLE